MEKLRIVVILLFGSAMIVSLTTAYRDRQELEKVKAANEFLRKTLGEMTIAMRQAPCPPK
jgi:CHASE3 domain sensor protein